MATAGVIAIARPQPTADYVGIGLALAAGCSWAAYILLNRTIGSRIPGVQGTATATGVSAALFLPLGAWILLTSRPDAFTLLCSVGAGVLASTVPFVADLIALRRIPAHLFGILMSVNPVLAALIGAILLHEDLGTIEWIGIALIVTANTAALLLRGAPPTAASQAIGASGCTSEPPVEPRTTSTWAAGTEGVSTT